MNTISGQGADPSCQRRQCSRFLTQNIPVKGVTLYVRTGGEGPAVVLLHSYVETELARDHTVIAPDLRGMGLTSRPEGGYDKKIQGHDIAGMLPATRNNWPPRPISPNSTRRMPTRAESRPRWNLCRYSIPRNHIIRNMLRFIPAASTSRFMTCRKSPT